VELPAWWSGSMEQGLC